MPWSPGDARNVGPGDRCNRKGTEQPIAATLARDLRPWLRGIAPGVPVLPLHHETVKAMRRDLAAAGVAYQTDEGIADFHSLRGLYIFALIRSRGSIKTVQTLARHSNPSLTLARYARTNIHDVAGAVESLPDLSRPASPVSEPLARTGTEGQLIGDPLSHYLLTGGDGEGRREAEPGGIHPATLAMDERKDASQPPAGAGVGRIVTHADGYQTERGGFCWGTVISLSPGEDYRSSLLPRPNLRPASKSHR